MNVALFAGMQTDFVQVVPSKAWSVGRVAMSGGGRTEAPAGP